MTRNRKVAYRTVKGRDIQPHPANWRRHPEYQRNAMRDVLAEVGNVDVLKVVELPDGRLMNLDGHLRADLMADEDVEVVVLDLDESEQRYVLATFDPLGMMAQADRDAQMAAFAAVQTESAAVRAMLEAISNGETQPMPDFEPVPESEQSRLDQANLVQCPACGHEFTP